MNDKWAGMGALYTDLGIIVVCGIFENWKTSNK